MLSSPRAARLSAVAAGCVAAIALGPACGGNGNQTTGSGGAGATGGGGSTADGGFGGTLFGSSSSGTSNGGTGGTGGKPVNCDPAPTAGVAAWANRYGDASGQYARGVSQDAQGNVLVAGAFSGTMTLGGTTLTSAGATDIFVAKFASDGSPTPASIKRFGDAKTQGARAVAAGPNGSMIIVGSFLGTFSFGGGQFTSNNPNFEDLFIAKLAADGSHVWSKASKDINTDIARCVAVDASGNVAVGGDYQSDLRFVDDSSQSPAFLVTTTGVSDAFVAVFDVAGTLKWVKSFGDAAGGNVNQSVHGVAFDKNGDVVITGVAEGTVSFGTGNLSAPGAASTFVAKLDAAGATKWAKLFGAGQSSGEGVAVDASGNVFVTGDHTGAIDFGGGALANGFGPNVFVAKLDTQGNHVWSRSFGDDGAQHGTSIGVDGAGRPVIVGSYASKIDFGDGALVSAGGVDAFAVKLDTVGCQVWAKSFGDPVFQEATAVFVDAAGNSLVTGNVSGSVDFGKGMLSGNSDDVFIAKFAP